MTAVGVVLPPKEVLKFPWVDYQFGYEIPENNSPELQEALKAQSKRFDEMIILEQSQYYYV